MQQRSFRQAFLTGALTLVGAVFATGCASILFFDGKNKSGECSGKDCPAPAKALTANDAGPALDVAAVWFPFSWTVEIPQKSDPQGGTPLAELQLRDVSLRLSSLKDKKKHVVQLATLGASRTSNAALDGRESLRTFYLPPLFSLPDGEYAIEGITARYLPSVEQQGGDVSPSQEILFPLPNIYSDKSNQALVFTTVKGKVAALPRASMVTRVFANGKGLGHISEMETKDKEFIPADVVALQLGKGNAASARLFAASPDFPRLRVRLTTSPEPVENFEPPSARVGMIFDAPCDFQGQYRLIWKRAGDDREYFSTLNVPSSNDQSCSNLRKVPLQFLAPKGEWHLLATYYSKSSGRDGFKLPPASQRDAAYGEYFRIRQEDDALNWWGREHDIKRKIGFTVKEGTLDANLLFYAGRLSLSTGGSENEKPGTLATLWDRRYSVAELKNLFHASEVFNAFSGMPLTRDQTKDQVQSVLRVQSSRPELAEPFAAELRKRSTEMFAQCVIEREQIDPLITVSGVLAFTITKTTNYIDFEKLDIASDRESVIWIRDCVERRLRSFRFGDKVPVRVTGEIKFQLE